MENYKDASFYKPDGLDKTFDFLGIINQCKYDVSKWSISDCKTTYGINNTFHMFCKCAINDDIPSDCLLIIEPIDQYVELSFKSGVETGFRFSDIGITIETFPLDNKVLLNGLITVIIDDNRQYNIFCMSLKYLNYLYTNDLIDVNDPLIYYDEIDSLESNVFPSIISDYFSSEYIKSISFENTEVQFWGRHNQIKDVYHGEVMLLLGLLDSSKTKSTSYKNALKIPRFLRLFVIYDNLASVLNVNVKTQMKMFINKESLEIFITDKLYYEGYNIKFEDKIQFRNAVLYLYISLLREDFSDYIQQSTSSKLYSNTNNVVNKNKQHNSLEKQTDNNQYNPYEKLNNLVGLESIKEDVNNLINLMKMQVRRKEQGLKPVPISLHLVFSGNPGTGKTTIARILAEIYKDIGILSKGQLIEVDRSGLVAGYVGQTAIKTQEKIEEALGGVLFIDEAYTLVKDGNDYGQEAIDTILKAMEDYREDFVVIVAGYSELMHSFINSNPGLKSRFNKYIDFPDYTVEELILIFCNMCKEYNFMLSNDAKNAMIEIIFEMEKTKDSNFANARDIRNLFEKVITNQATRLASDPNANIQLISSEDFK